MKSQGIEPLVTRGRIESLTHESNLALAEGAFAHIFVGAVNRDGDTEVCIDLWRLDDDDEKPTRIAFEKNVTPAFMVDLGYLSAEGAQVSAVPLMLELMQHYDCLDDAIGCLVAIQFARDANVTMNKVKDKLHIKTTCRRPHMTESYWSYAEVDFAAVEKFFVHK